MARVTHSPSHKPVEGEGISLSTSCSVCWHPAYDLLTECLDPSSQVLGVHRGGAQRKSADGQPKVTPAGWIARTRRSSHCQGGELLAAELLTDLRCDSDIFFEARPIVTVILSRGMELHSGRSSYSGDFPRGGGDEDFVGRREVLPCQVLLNEVESCPGYDLVQNVAR